MECGGKTLLWILGYVVREDTACNPKRCRATALHIGQSVMQSLHLVDIIRSEACSS